MPFTLSRSLTALLASARLLITLARGPSVRSIAEVTVASSVSRGDGDDGGEDLAGVARQAIEDRQRGDDRVVARLVSLSKMAATVRVLP